MYKYSIVALLHMLSKRTDNSHNVGTAPKKKVFFFFFYCLPVMPARQETSPITLDALLFVFPPPPQQKQKQN